MSKTISNSILFSLLCLSTFLSAQSTSGSSGDVIISGHNMNGSGCQTVCGPSSQSVWQSGNQCYCGDEGKKVGECVFKASPTWPLLPAKLGKDTQCPSPVTDSAGFSKCTQDKIKQADPNAQSTVNSCVSSTGAKSSGSSGTTTGSSTTGSSSTDPSSSKPNAAASNAHDALMIMIAYSAFFRLSLTLSIIM